MSRSGKQRQPAKTLQQEWEAFLIELSKRKPQPPAVYQVLKESLLGSIDENSITLLFPNEEQKANANPQKIQNILPPHLKRNKVYCKVNSPEQIHVESPLQALNLKLFSAESNKQELVKPVLEAATAADVTCEPLYKYLTDKTKRLAQEILEVKFPWRLRVGGMRGFRDLLLPVFHPVYGVPYIPSSSLKGATRAIALLSTDKDEVNRLLGKLDDGIGCVQFLDAFPTAPCLSIDMVNPQWSWDNNHVKYQPVPHAFLSMAQPQLVIGLSSTSRGTNPDDLKKVKHWLEEALATGIGSRLSAGYGRTKLRSGLPYSSSHEFQLWSQGIYGADTNNPEFRPVALRGVLRYWFRAIALGLYSPSQCKELEATLFGTIETTSKEGSVRIAVEWKAGDSKTPYFCKGTILLEAKNQQHLTLIEKLLYLSFHIAGIGRGSRRPLHWNSGRMRGCHWELNQGKLPCDRQAWQDIIQQLRKALLDVEPPQDEPSGGDSGNSNTRYQDVLNSNARIYLVPCAGMKHPNNVRNWSSEGHTPPVRGQALELLYSSPKYKGNNQQKEGNPEVGGQLGIPSFVVIKSNFPNSGQPYQTVTIFGADNPARADFITALPSDSIRVW